MTLVGEGRGGARGACGAPGRRWHEHWLRLEQGGGKGSMAGGLARHAGRSIGWAKEKFVLK
jgi:hypothetical protein